MSEVLSGDMNKKEDEAINPQPSSGKISDTFSDSLADVHLVSSDNVVFKIQSFYLMAARSMLTDVRAYGAPKIIELPDAETSPNVTSLLRQMSGRSPEISFCNTKYDRVRGLILIAQKYDCHMILDAVRHRILAAMNKTGSSPFRLFIHLCLLGDYVGCKVAIPLAGAKTWGPIPVGMDGEKRVNLHVVGESLMDPMAMSTYWTSQIPPACLAALLRASRQRGNYQGGQGNWSAVADEFCRLLQ